MHGLRLGKLGGYFLERLDDEVRARFEEALERLSRRGLQSSIADSGARKRHRST
jgi:hypothetical protein